MCADFLEADDGNDDATYTRETANRDWARAEQQFVSAGFREAAGNAYEQALQPGFSSGAALGRTLAWDFGLLRGEILGWLAHVKVCCADDEDAVARLEQQAKLLANSVQLHLNGLVQRVSDSIEAAAAADSHEARTKSEVDERALAAFRQRLGTLKSTPALSCCCFAPSSTP